MPASEEWRYHTVHESELSPTAQQVGAPFQNKSNDLMHIRRIDGDLACEQGSPDDSAVLEIKKDSALTQVADGSGIPVQRISLSVGDQATNTHGQTKQRSWNFPRGAMTLEENESYYCVLIIRNTATGEKYAGDVTFAFHY